MTIRQIAKRAAKVLAVAGGAAAAGYAGLVAFNRLRYGKPSIAYPPGVGPGQLDRFIPVPEVAEQHHISVHAPAATVLAVAREIELLNSPLVRTLIKAREIALGGEADRRTHPAALIPQMLSIGWVILAEEPDREIVLGAVTKPWEANTVFRSVPPDAFAAFDEPGYVKIAWTLRAIPHGAGASTFYTETRVCTTDAATRARFRNYWSFVAPGVKLIRWTMLRPLKVLAEHHAGRHAA